MKDIGPIVHADENMTHQTADTFAVISVTERSWAEKVWGSFFKKDGSIQIDFGLGVYQNRGVIDGFGGISRGKEQWTVRGSRELMSDINSLDAGPVKYEIIKPQQEFRFCLEPNDACGIAFDVTFKAEFLPFFEERNKWREANGRVQSDVVRFHQAGTVEGWLSIDGVKEDVSSDEWFAVRDRSWGIRGEGAVGYPIKGVAQTRVQGLDGVHPTLILWTPWCFTKPDGEKYEIHILYTEISGFRVLDSAYVNYSDGRQEKAAKTESNLTFDSETRYLTGGSMTLCLNSGERLDIAIEPLGDTGFHLKTGGYGEWKGKKHGLWQGELAVDGEYIADCSERSVRVELGQFRDKPVRLTCGDDIGYGIFETVVTGEWPELGLTKESDYGRW